MSASESNIHVVVRLRPLVTRETSKKDESTIKTQGNMIIINDPIDEQFRKEGKNKLDVYHRSREQKYAFDR